MLKKLSKLFHKYLLFGNIVSSGVLMSVGDLIEQLHEVSISDNEKKIDWIRNVRLTFVGAGMGVINHYYYGLIDKLFPTVELKHIVIKLVADQVIASPVCITFLFYVDGILLRLPISEINDEFKEKYFTIYFADCMVWPPIQFINFRYVSSQYRVVYLNTAQMFYNIYLSQVLYTVPEIGSTEPYMPTRFVSLEAFKEH